MAVTLLHNDYDSCTIDISCSRNMQTKNKDSNAKYKKIIEINKGNYSVKSKGRVTVLVQYFFFQTANFLSPKDEVSQMLWTFLYRK